MCAKSRRWVAGTGYRIEEHPDQLPLPLEHSATGSKDSPGPTGEPSLSERLGELTVRLHQGLSTISAGFSMGKLECPGTFTALKRGDLGGYTVMLSCYLTSSNYSALIAMLETTPTLDGASVTVDVTFEPMTPNLVPPTTVPST